MCLIWNSLPKSLRSCNQTNVFKKELKTYFFNEAFRDIKISLAIALPMITFSF